MTKCIITLVFFVTSLVGAQTQYEQGMQKAFALWGEGKTTEASAMFERIASAEKNNWLPNYYVSMVNTTAAFQTKDKDKVAALLGKAQEALNIELDKNPENPELLDLNIATCLYTGTMTDTGSFRFPATSASVHRMVAHFNDMGLQHTPIHEQVYDSFLENRLRFIGHALLNRMDVLYEYNTAVMAISRDDIIKYDIKTGDTEGLVNYLLTIKGIKFGAIVIDRNEERKWSFRSKGDFDVNVFARNHFEGGGHKNAAGGRSSHQLEKTLAHFYEVLPNYKNELE